MQFIWNTTTANIIWFECDLWPHQQTQQNKIVKFSVFIFLGSACVQLAFRHRLLPGCLDLVTLLSSATGLLCASVKVLVAFIFCVYKQPHNVYLSLMFVLYCSLINTVRSLQTACHLADEISKSIFLYEDNWYFDSNATATCFKWSWQ